MIHSLDITLALDEPTVAPPRAVVAILDQLTAAQGAVFAVDLTKVQFEATDTDWSWGTGDIVRADSGSLVQLLSGRTLPDTRTLRRG